MVLEKTLESPLDYKEIQPVHPKGDQFWVFIGRTYVEAETPVLWPPDAKNWLIGKDPDAGKGWGQEEKGTTEDEIVGWHHRLNGYEFGWTPGIGNGQGGLACSVHVVTKSRIWLSDWTELSNIRTWSKVEKQFFFTTNSHSQTLSFYRVHWYLTNDTKLSKILWSNCIFLSKENVYDMLFACLVLEEGNYFSSK